MTDQAVVERLQQEAPVWFALLRDRICAAFEALEDEVTAPLPP
jgi:coproporphyrinogen III oxidase